ncbi:MAG: EamA family transporter [Candidatus Saccharibacteria bacterium]|nr:EamA family transporter [Candidatus Saccharibacteria bacterium]
MKTVLALLTVTLAEATIGVFVKLVSDDVPILALNFYRVLFATVFLAIALAVTGKKFWKFPDHNARDVLLIAALIGSQISLYNWAISLTTIANAVVFWSIAPFFVFIFSWAFLDEPAKKQYVLIFLVAFLGLFIAEPFGGGHVTGNLIALLTGAVYAGAITYMRHEGKEETGTDVFWYLLIAVVYLLPGIFISGTGPITEISKHGLFGLPVPIIFWAVCLGVISTGLAYFFISVVLRTVSANVYSLVDIIVSPLVAALLGYLVLAEVPSVELVYGGVLLLGSGFWLTRAMSQAEKKKMPPPTSNPR